MAIIKNAIVTDSMSFKGYGGAELNLIYGGQYGHHHRAGLLDNDGRHYEEWMNAAQYVQQPIIPILMNYPKACDFLGDQKQQFIGTLRSVIETRSHSIDGFNSKLTVNTSDFQIGKSGGEFIEDYTKVVRERSQPVHSIREVLGEAVNSFLSAYIKYFINDPDTGTIRIINSIPPAKRPKLWTHDWYSFSVLYIEPNPQHTKAHKAWLLLGGFPKGTGEINGKRDTASDNEVKEHSIELAGLVLPPDMPGMIDLATRVLLNLTVLRTPIEKTMQMPINNIDPAVEDTGIGYSRATDR